jgi:RNA polymerase sigma factor (sigma-70 family)
MFRNRIDRWFAQYCRHGDPRSLARVFDHATPELWRVARYLCRDPHVAEDAVQGTFLTAIEARGDWDPTRPLLPWLLGLLVNRVREERRRNARRPEPERLATPRGEGDPADTATRRELDATLRSAMLRLDEPYRSTLEQHLVHGRSANEIATRERIAAGTVRMRLHRALDRLRHGLPKGLIAGGLGTRLPTAEAMASMRATVLAKAGAAVGSIDPAAATGVAVAAAHTRKAGLALTAVAVVVLTATLTTTAWLRLPLAGAEPRADAAGPTARPVAHATPDAGVAAGERGAPTREAVAARTGQLRVRVLSRGGLEPVHGAKVAVFADRGAPLPRPTPVAATQSSTGTTDASDAREGTTDADGVATFELPAGPARIEVHEPSVESAMVTVPAGSTVDEVVFASPPLRAQVQVVDANGAAVAHARLVARANSDDASPDQQLGETDRDGHWRGQLPGGACVVRAHASGHASSRAATLSTRRAAVTLQLGGPSAGVTGTVRDRDGRPIAGAHIALQPENDGVQATPDACHVTRADADGRYELGHIAPGAHTIYAWHGDRNERRITRASLTAFAARTTVVDPTFGGGVRIAVELTRPDGRPWVGCGFEARAEQQPTHGILVGRFGPTDDHGKLLIADLPPDRYHLTATVDQERVHFVVDLHEGEELAFRRVIGNGAWLEVLLTDATGAPLHDWVVQTNDVVPVALDHDALWPRQPSRRTDRNGVARFEDVPDRPTWVTVRRADARTPLVSREVPANARSTFALSAAQQAQRRVSGHIGAHDVGGAATFEAHLIPLGAAPTMFTRGIEAAVAPDGSLRFDGVPPGSYGLSVMALDANGSRLGRVAWQRGITVTGEHDVDLGAVPTAIADVEVGLLRSDGAAVVDPRLVSRLAPGHPFQSCKQVVRGDRVVLQGLPAGSVDVLTLGDNCAPQVAPVIAPHSGRGAVVVVQPAATVTVQCEGLRVEGANGTQRVLRDGRIWFEEDVHDARRPYRIGLPPGSYRVEFTLSGGRWTAEFTLGNEPVEVDARRTG